MQGISGKADILLFNSVSEHASGASSHHAGVGKIWFVECNFETVDTRGGAYKPT